MRVVQCTNGHFFDADSFDSCSECGAKARNSALNSAIAKDNKNKSGVFKKWKRKNDENTNTSQTISGPAKRVLENTEGARISTVAKTDNKKNGLSIENTEPNCPQNDNDGKTVAFWDTFSNPADIDMSSVFPPNKLSSELNPFDNPFDTKNDFEAEIDFKIPISAEPPKIPDSIGLKKAVQAASASSDGKTTSYFTSKTSPQKQCLSSGEPVTGWLVAVSGSHKGESFCVYSGNNSIGRSNTNRIVLRKDDSVSRDNHAFVVFEPKKALFYFRPGEASGLSYVNNDIVNSVIPLNIHDIIEIGETKMLFIPLCSEKFSWEDYI